MVTTILHQVQAPLSKKTVLDCRRIETIDTVQQAPPVSSSFCTSSRSRAITENMYLREKRQRLTKGSLFVFAVVPETRSYFVTRSDGKKNKWRKLFGVTFHPMMTSTQSSVSRGNIPRCSGPLGPIFWR